MAEKRQHLRVRVSMLVTCQPALGAPFGAVMTDLGLGGSCIESTQAPAFGSKLTIAAQLPGSPGTSQLPATVRWSRPGSFGVQFGLLGARDTRLLAELMAHAVRKGE